MIVAAIYFPQFHADSTLIGWFGNRGSDWQNIRTAASRFDGHHILTPGELGEYVLSDPFVRIQQRELALSHGIDAFCYYHYWSDGDRLLDVVERSVLSREVHFEMPFFLCWANHDWYRALAGSGRENLRAQRYSTGLFDDHVSYLQTIFAHPRYVRIGGRPIVIVYEPLASPNLRDWVDRLHASSVISPLALGVEWQAGDREKILRARFDGSVAPIPHLSRLSLPSRLCGDQGLTHNGDFVINAGQLDLYLHELETEAWKGMQAEQIRVPATYVGWDNTPRRKTGAKIVMENTPARLRARMETALSAATLYSQRMVLLNAWNEWGEGSALEPSKEFGRAFLEAVSQARITHDSVYVDKE